MSNSDNKKSEHYDVIVIGGGASGMMVAGTAAKRGRRVLMIEKNKELGKKLSITGGGRCNITNAEFDSRAFLDNFGDRGKFFHSALAQFGVQDTFDFFQSLGLPLVVQARKRAFPETERAPDVTKAMKRYASQSGVTVRTGVKVRGFLMDNDILRGVKTTEGSYTADAVVLATGGRSHSETGATGEGIGWLSALGHTVHDPSPDIVPLKAVEEWPKLVSGNTLSFMKITFGRNLTKAEGKFSKVGKILFTHFGISGPLVLNSANQVKKLLEKGQVHTEIDMYPDTEIGTLRNRVIEVFNHNKNKALKNVLKEIVPAGMSDAVAAQFDPELLDTKVHSIEKEVRLALVTRLKAMPLIISGTMGYDWAVVADGGVDLREVDMKTMESTKVKNLYFTGDVLHVSRPSGGYSLQLCWTTGFVAGQNV